ncbi:MAG: DUF6468 domain-containing protein [Bdellovibrionales bacterium]
MNISWLGFLMDITLAGLLCTGIYYAMRLAQQLEAMRTSRAEMERFVIDFSATVTRAENGIKGLKTTARSSGDDLEKLIDQAKHLRDELHFLVESADKIAERLSNTAASATRQTARPQQEAPLVGKPAPQPTQQKTVQQAAPQKRIKTHEEALAALTGNDKLVSSTAEKELLRALKKIG